MARNNDIPLLNSRSYAGSYFGDKAGNDGAHPAAPSLQHFEIHHRCGWQNLIQAHRLDFYMVFIVTAGEGLHTFGLQEHFIKENMLCFVSPDMISAWQANDHEHRGYFCAFSDDFFNLGRENKHFLSELPFFQIDGNPVLHLTGDQMQHYLALFKQMHDEYEHRNAYSGDLLRSYLQVLLNKAYAQYRTAGHTAAHANHAGVRLLKAFTACYQRDFKALNEGHDIRIKKVADYARELGVSQNHLNDTIKAITGRSAGQLIRNQLIKQATMCLKHSTKSISEIAYRLGYTDPSYFARYYKKQTGQSPSGFR